MRLEGVDTEGVEANETCAGRIGETLLVCDDGCFEEVIGVGESGAEFLELFSFNISCFTLEPLLLVRLGISSTLRLVSKLSFVRELNLPSVSRFYETSK